jgi:DOPA 4,5-dioxygenase
MFEVNLFTPAQFGAFIPWLVINRGPLSALVHPNTVDSTGSHEDEYRDHTQRATWLGQPLPLDLSLFHEMKKRKAEAAAAEKNQEGLVMGLKKNE